MSIKAPERIEIPESEAPRERFARFLAIAIVIATLGVASVEFLHSYADWKADGAGVEAQKLGVERQGELSRAIEATHSDLDAFNQSQVQQTQQGVAFQEFLRPSVTSGSDEEKQFSLENDRYQQLAALTLDLSSIKPDSANGPQKDLFFPNVAFSTAEEQSDKLFALEDARNAERHSWESLLSQYSVVLTMFAVAVYLLGLSLTLQRGVARLMTGFAISLVVIGALWTGGLQLMLPKTAPDAAADAYAQGMLAFSTQYNSPGVDQLRAADADFTKAIQLRPDFAYAYLERSQVRFLIGSPQRLDSYTSVTTKDALAASDADLQKAYDLGLHTYMELNNLAANRLLLAIDEGRSAGYDEAIGYLDQAIEFADSDPLLYFNRATAYLGKGDFDKANSDLDAGIQRTLYINVDKKTPRNDSWFANNQVGGELTDLDMVATHRSDLRNQINTMKAHLVTAVELNQAKPPSGSPKVGAVTIDVFPAQLEWTADIANFTPSKDFVSAQWYHQAAPNLDWAVLEGVSGKASAGQNGATQGQYWAISDSLSTLGTCLPATGKYKVELYINGTLAATQTADAPKLPTLTAERVTSIGVGICRPPAWKTQAPGALTGFISVDTATDGSAGIFLVHYAHPENPDGRSQQDLVTGYRDNFVSLMNDYTLLPAAATFDADDSNTYFLGMDVTSKAFYKYDGGEALVASGLMSDGSIMEMAVFDTSANFNGDNPTVLRVFDSAVLI